MPSVRFVGIDVDGQSDEQSLGSVAVSCACHQFSSCCVCGNRFWMASCLCGSRCVKRGGRVLKDGQECYWTIERDETQWVNSTCYQAIGACQICTTIVNS